MGVSRDGRWYEVEGFERFPKGLLPKVRLPSPRSLWATTKGFRVFRITSCSDFDSYAGLEGLLYIDIS